MKVRDLATAGVGRWTDQRHLDVAWHQLTLADRPRASGYASGYVNNFFFTEPDFR